MNSTTRRLIGRLKNRWLDGKKFASVFAKIKENGCQVDKREEFIERLFISQWPKEIAKKNAREIPSNFSNRPI